MFRCSFSLSRHKLSPLTMEGCGAALSPGPSPYHQDVGFWHAVGKGIAFLVQCFFATLLTHLTFCFPYLEDDLHFASTPRGLRKGHAIRSELN